MPENPKRDDKKFVSVFDIEWGRKPSTRKGVSKSKPEGTLLKLGKRLKNQLINYLLSIGYLRCRLTNSISRYR